METKVIKSEFSLDFETFYKGYTSGDLWNGWECPSFPFEEVMKMIADKVGEDIELTYDESKDVFTTTEDDYIEEYTPQMVNFGGDIIKVYPIGAYGWTWVNSQNINAF